MRGLYITLRAVEEDFNGTAQQRKNQRPEVAAVYLKVILTLADGPFS